MCIGGCGNVVRSGRCFLCRRAQERRRGSPAQRGYGADHRKARQNLALMLPLPCGYCRQAIQRGERWVAAHVKDGRPEYGWMVAHPGCNERAKVRA